MLRHYPFSRYGTSNLDFIVFARLVQEIYYSFQKHTNEPKADKEMLDEVYKLISFRF